MCFFALLACFPSDDLCILEFEAGAGWAENEVKGGGSGTGKLGRGKDQEQIHGLTPLESGWM